MRATKLGIKKDTTRGTNDEGKHAIDNDSKIRSETRH